MKRFRVFCLIFGVLVRDGCDASKAEILRTTRENCIAESGVDSALIDKVNSGGGLENCPKLKCYIKCMMTTLGALSSDGVVVEDAIIAGIDAGPLYDRYVSMVRNCKTQGGSDLCETAFNTHVCYQNQDPEIYYLI